MSASAAGLLAVLLVLVATAVTLVAGDAVAAPYPPSEPCTVWTATADPVATTDGDLTLTVVGSGLGPAEPVRLVHTASQRTVGYARTTSDGRFRAVVSAPAGPEGEAPQISAASPDATCTTPVPPTDGRTPPGGGGGNGGGDGGNGNGGGGGAGTSGVPPSATRSGAASSPAGTTPTTPPTSGAASGTASGAVPTSTTTQADPPRIIDTPFTIGLVIAAILLVLGTLLVLMIARRPDHR